MSAPLGLLLACLAALPVGLLVYGALIEPRRIALDVRDVPLARWPAALDGFTILHITDLHSLRTGPVERFLTRLPGTLPDGAPDVVVFTGDLPEAPAGIAHGLAALRPLTARLGRFAVLGNNDLVTLDTHLAVAHGLEADDWRLLRDEAVPLTVNGRRLWLGGATYRAHCWCPTADLRFGLAEAFAAAPADEPRLALAHTPDAVVEAAESGVDLLLCGHTHGGQICLPGGIALRNQLRRFPPPRFSRGLYRLPSGSGAAAHPLVLFVNRGLGMSSPQLRLFARPQVVLLRLRPMPT